MRKLLLFAVLGLMLAATVFFVAQLWVDAGTVEISLLGWILVAGGVVFAFAMGGGLMALAFYSDRRGHDDAHHRQSAFDPRNQPKDDEPDQRLDV